MEGKRRNKISKNCYDCHWHPSSLGIISGEINGRLNVKFFFLGIVEKGGWRDILVN